MRLLRSFFALNRRLSQTITPDHFHEANVFAAYHKIGAILLSHPNTNIVLDVGAGKQWHFPEHYKSWYRIKLIGLDIDGAEMEDNLLLDEKIKCDAVEQIPVPAGTVDLVMISSGIEHFNNNQKFLENAFEVLRPGGYLIAQFPGRYAPFAIANRLLPKSTSSKWLAASMGESAEHLGFTAHYDRTNYSSFQAMVRDSGFNVIYHLPGYNSSSYLEFFVPFYLVSYFYDSVLHAMGVRDLAAYNLWVLRKPGEADLPEFKLYAWK
ncbi:class I SAM-dependent methyltransferase [Bradyrhizobium sp. CCBAU 53421]|uniref:class I SAM-dependent methyltransferase n=1 Tax=Bradyrhizobium sp. CCBAU 53421 TaxID=1325120 RepID=UPI00188D50E8|nr:methyltransferase domain-containing protein [Bradyrhizobium sp. CCBAU 53421]QOZ37857.1 class I SAM-dependent methyltransferase [Bradyrhizobium sp. CCBAU 53421]